MHGSNYDIVQVIKLPIDWTGKILRCLSRRSFTRLSSVSLADLFLKHPVNYNGKLVVVTR